MMRPEMPYTSFRMTRIFLCFVFACLWVPSGNALVPLWSRRETIFGIASSLGFPSSLITDSSIEETTLLDYSGVYRDPKHPQGYRIVRTGGPGRIAVTVRDSADGPTLQLVGTSIFDSATQKTNLQISVPTKDGQTNLLPAVFLPDQVLYVNFCEASVAGGGELLTMGSIRFPDGNIWVKDNGLQGVYVDSRFPDGYRIIRELGNARVSIDVADRVDQLSTTLSAVINKSESSLVIDFSPVSGPKRLSAEIRGKDLIFKDGTTWTKL